jgi:uncharacterized protein YcfL
MKILYKLFFLSFFLLTGCSSLQSVDYKNIRSFSAIITDINGQALNCSYERGYTINCFKIESEVNYEKK